MTTHEVTFEACQRLVGPLYREEQIPELVEFLNASQRANYAKTTGAEFAKYFVDRFVGQEPPYQRLYGSDIYLAYCCLNRSPEALNKFDSQLAQEVRAVTRGRSAAGNTGEDLCQAISVALLTGGTDGVPKLQQYAGRSPIGTWLRVVAIRHFSRASDKGRNEVLLEQDRLAELVHTADPELNYMKQAYRVSFKQAFQEAFESLSLHDRQLLRQTVIDGLNIDALGKLHNMHRATAARHLAGVRGTLFERTQKRMRDSLDLSPEDLRDVMNLIRSHLDVSLTRLLAKPGRRAKKPVK